jgi:hypothetical protein
MALREQGAHEEESRKDEHTPTGDPAAERPITSYGSKNAGKDLADAAMFRRGAPPCRAAHAAVALVFNASTLRWRNLVTPPPWGVMVNTGR